MTTSIKYTYIKCKYYKKYNKDSLKDNIKDSITDCSTWKECPIVKYKIFNCSLLKCHKGMVGLD